MAWNTCSITFLQAKKGRLGRRPNQRMMKWSNPPEALERASGTHVLHRGASLMAIATKCLIIRLDIDYRQGWLEGEAADCYLFARSAYGGET